jgi:type IV pilus assembly protein PilX
MSVNAAARQRGAVLVVSLVLLVVLTLLGVSVMNVTQLEERMASNAQEMTQAFQSAETGLSQAYANSTVWNPSSSVSQAMTPIPTGLPAGVSRADQASYTVEYITATGPPPGYDVSQFQTAHFDFESTGQSQSNFTAVLHGGGFRVFRNAGFLP